MFSFLVRMNFSHGSYEYHQSVIDNTRKMVAREFILHFFTSTFRTTFNQWIHMDVPLPSLWTQLAYLPLKREIYTNPIPQKGPEIRTGLTREGKDVRHCAHCQYYLIISSSGPFPLVTSSSSRPTPDTAKFAMTRSCGLTM